MEGKAIYFYTSSLAQSEAGHAACDVCHHPCHNIREYNSLVVFQSLALAGSPARTTTRIIVIVMPWHATHCMWPVVLGMEVNQEMAVSKPVREF